MGRYFGKYNEKVDLKMAQLAQEIYGKKGVKEIAEGMEEGKGKEALLKAAKK
jgi:hypothetical protein